MMRKRVTVAGLPRILAAALVAAACSESVGPGPVGPRSPQTDVTASGITFDQMNGALNQSGNVLIKGFNPTNPHVGDAIVATFFWIDPTLTHINIITSVTDRLTNVDQTPVGRTATHEEVAAVVRFVMSAEASYVNGAVIPVDGGLTA